MENEKNSRVIEEYLQIIYQFHLKNHSLKAVTLAERMNASGSTVHATLQRMQRDGLIEIIEKKNIQLTPQGIREAQDITFRHNLAEYFLCNSLGIPWYEVHEHAHRLEHAMTPLITEKLAEFLNFPNACPHGTPMPGYPDEILKNSFSLDQARDGSQIKVLMIDESLEDSKDVLRHLFDQNILPGNLFSVHRQDALKFISLKSDDHQITLPFEITEKIQVIEV